MGLALLADLGGTNTRVALAKGPKVIESSIRRFPNADFKARGEDIADILRLYLAENGVSVEGLCVAVAGPVQDGVAEMTNLHWVMDAQKLGAATGAARVVLLNDLQAQGHALGHIADAHLREIMAGPVPALGGDRSSMLVVGLGTGVNAAPVHGKGASRVVPASECGHVDMPVRDETDLRLLQFIEELLASRGESRHAGVEELLAGRGLANLHAFAVHEAGAHEAGRDGGLSSSAVLAALEAGDPIAVRTAELYTRILAHFLADQALIHLPWGGIFLIGGMARAMSPYFERFNLTKIFREQRRIDLLTHAFRINVVEDDYAALTGCAAWLEASR